MSAHRFKGCTLAEVRAQWGLPPDEPDTDAPVKTEALPALDETVHVWAKDGALGCTPMHVVGYLGGRDVVAAGLYLQEFCDTASSPIRSYPAPTHDEARTVPCSWHYPCDGDGHAAGRTPAAPAPNITINVSGSVLAERDLRYLVRQQIKQALHQTWGRYTAASYRR